MQLLTIERSSSIIVTMPKETLSLKCVCGYIKHDIMHLGEWQCVGSCLLNYCGGLLQLNGTGDAVLCRKCSTTLTTVNFHCSFCDRVTDISVGYKTAEVEGRVTVMQMSVHKTILFSA